MLPIEEAIVEKLRKAVHAALMRSSRAFPMSVGGDIRRRGSHVAGRTGVPSPTRLLDLSDLTWLAAYRIQFSTEWEGDAIKSERVDCGERPRRGRDDEG